MKEKYWHTKDGFICPEGGINTRGVRFATFRWLANWLFKKPYELGKDLPIDHVMTREEAVLLLNEQPDFSLTWLGHATFLIRVNGVSILTDPLLFGNPAPGIMRSMKRLPNPLSADDFNVDVLLLSHEHHDHIHHPSLGSLLNKETIQPVIPLGMSGKIKKYTFKKPVELDWFDSYVINDSVSVTAVPAIHYSNSSNSSLWSGYVITYKDSEGNKRKIYFGGDTGYGEFFSRDIAPYGPFDVAILGIGAFYISFPTRAPVVHTSPEQAVEAAKEVNAKKLIGMHWGTIKLAEEDPKTLFPRARAHAKEIGYEGNITQMRIGETIPLEG